jgi:hypothetical protein
MQGTIASDTSHHRAWTTLDVRRYKASSPAMHHIIAREPCWMSGDARHHRRRCMTSSRVNHVGCPASKASPPAMHDIIARDSSSIAGDA